MRLTKKQDLVYSYMQDYFLENHRLPTCAQIAYRFQYSSANAGQTHINALERKGYLVRLHISNNKSVYRFAKLKPILIPSS